MGRIRHSFDFGCMDVMPVVLDISSDDETGVEALADSFDWLKEFLGVSDEEAHDSDDVVIVGEVKANPKKNREPVKDQEDDCVVLDGDPDKSISTGEEPDDASNEIVVVGQKGEIACRDYPHPRHHCARFPFASTPHEKHCHQCHCYVCDSLAPCLYWGTGFSKSDHCHGTDKAEMWKVLRRDFKHGSDASSPTLKSTGTAHEIAPTQANHDIFDQNVLIIPSTLQNQISGSISTPPVQPLPNSIAQNQSSMEPITCAFLSRLNTSSVGLSTFSVHAPHPVNDDQNQVSGGLLESSRYANPLIQNQALCSNTRRDPGHVTRIGPQLGPTSVMLKRPRTNGIVRRVAGSAYSSLNSHLDSATQNVENNLSGASNRSQCSQWSSIRACANLPYKFTDHSNLLDTNRVPPQSCTYDPSVIQSNSGQECYHLGNRDNRFQSIDHYHDDGGIGNTISQQDGGEFHSINERENRHPIGTGCPSMNRQVNKYRDNGGIHGINQHQNGREFQGIIQQENQDHIIPNDTYQPESLCMISQNFSQQENLSQNVKELVSGEGNQSQSLQITDHSANALRCVNDTIQSEYRPAESFQVQQEVGCLNEPVSVPESISPCSANAIDLEFEKWLSESHSPLLSPEPPPTDVGTLLYDLSYSCEM